MKKRNVKVERSVFGFGQPDSLLIAKKISEIVARARDATQNPGCSITRYKTLSTTKRVALVFSPFLPFSSLARVFRAGKSPYVKSRIIFGALLRRVYSQRQCRESILAALKRKLSNRGHNSAALTIIPALIEKHRRKDRVRER